MSAYYLKFLYIFFIFKYLYYNEVCFVETFDSNSYLVRNVPDKNEAANMLATIRSNLINFIDKLVLRVETDDEYYEYIKMIQKKLPKSIIKALPNHLLSGLFLK